ncbi:MAG: DUF2029 domain-containing protein [Armatimonadota bacterium]|nr:MAG: DUF2029 domain-containing protein [Armatimonadota bacterium]
MSREGRERGGVGVAWCVVGLGLAAAAALWLTGPGAPGRSWVPGFLPWYSAAWVCYVVAAVVVGRARQQPRWLLLWIVVAALAMRVVCLVRTPEMSTDVWRYLWDGRVTNAGINPYRYPPRAAGPPKGAEEREPSPHMKLLRALRNENWNPIVCKHLPTIYPPLAQMLFAGLAGVRERDAEAFRWAFILFDMGSVLVLIGLLRRTGRAPERMIWYAWCPLAATEVAAGAHVDAFALFPLLLALLLAARNEGRPGAASGIALAASVMAKGYALLAAPLFLRRGGWKLAVAFAVALLALAVPFAGARGHMFDGMSAYLDRWGVNASVFLLLDSLLARITSDHFHVARKITMAAVAAVVLVLVWRQKPGMEWLLGGTFAAIGAQLLLGAPTLPWYVLWVVPALCWWKIPALVLFTLTVSAQYYARGLWPGNEAAHHALLWAGYAPVYAVLIGHLMVWAIRRRRSAPSRSP